MDQEQQAVLTVTEDIQNIGCQFVSDEDNRNLGDQGDCPWSQAEPEEASRCPK